MNAKTASFIIIVTAVLVSVFFVLRREYLSSTGDATTPTKQEAQSEKAPNFSLQDYNGKTVNLADFIGKPIVLNSWAGWCPFCRKELPDFVTAQKEFGDKVVIVAINRQESLATAKGYTDTQGTSNDLIFLLDPDDSFYKSIGGFSMPETLFIDKNGAIIIHKRGPMDINEIRQKIKEIL
ncbi:MAG: TlpA disulfide reductase family protein [Patescibacteria group bacterium]